MTTDEMIRLEDAGMTRAEIARMAGVSPQSVSQRLLARGRLAPAVKLFDRDRAKELVAAGCNDAEIARQLGVATSAVNTWRRKYIDATPRDCKRGLRNEIARLLKTGKQPRVIAEQLGCASSYVRAVKQKIADPERFREYGRKYFAQHRAFINSEAAE